MLTRQFDQRLIPNFVVQLDAVPRNAGGLNVWEILSGTSICFSDSFLCNDTFSQLRSDFLNLERSPQLPKYGSIASPLLVNRVRVAELNIHSAWVNPFPLSVKRHVSGLGQCILHSLRVERPEFICEAQIDVVLKPRLIRPEMLELNNPDSRVAGSFASNEVMVMLVNLADRQVCLLEAREPRA